MIARQDTGCEGRYNQGMSEAWIIVVLLCGIGAPTPEATAAPLTESQQAQLATAQDNSPAWDEAALYPLLANVENWPEGYEAGAVVPDYAGLHESPATYRGQMFLIEGQLGGAPDPIRKQLARPGKWDGRLQQWSVVVHRDPDEAVVLILIDPMPIEQLPRRGGATIRSAARFYKVWSYVDRNNQPAQYLLFVGRSIKVGPAAIGGGRAHDKPWVFAVVLVVLMAAWYSFWRVRRVAMKPRAVPSMSRRAARHQAAEEVPDGSADAPLPDDPAEAMRELGRRHDQDTSPPGG